MNEEPHCIRLRSPWDGRCEPSDDVHDVRFHFRRRFGYPTGIGAGDRIWLVMELSPETGERAVVALNGEVLEPHDLAAVDSRWDVTVRLRPRNELLIEYLSRSNATASPTTVSPTLESSAIFRDLPSWIRDVRLEIVTCAESAKQGST